MVALDSSLKEEGQRVHLSARSLAPSQAPLRTTDQLAARVQAALLAVVLFSGAAIIATMLALIVLL